MMQWPQLLVVESKNGLSPCTPLIHQTLDKLFELTPSQGNQNKVEFSY